MSVSMEPDITEDTNSPIQQFFHGRSIFITGATGLVGKVLLEKLIRCCPGINKIYILMRPKKGETICERKTKLLETKLFSVVQKQFPSFSRKIVVVDGDILKSDLEISEEDRKALEKNVSVVFHLAAQIKFTSHLRVAIQHQVYGTEYVMNLCRKMTQLIAVIHVSTAFCLYNDDGTVPEAIEKCKPSLEQVLNALKWMDDNTISAITPAVVGKKYHTYCFTKCLAENLISEKFTDLPIVIVRPSVVGSTWKDPIPGWCDTLQGLSGITLACAKGFLRALHFPKNAKMNIIPLDILANTLISAAWHIGTKKIDQLMIVNCTSENETLLRVADLFSLLLKKTENYPLVKIFRYPDITVYNSKFLYRINSIIDHFIPAILLDSFLFIFTGKTMLVHLYLKIEYLLQVAAKTALTSCDFQVDNYYKIRKQMSEEDAKIFFIDFKDFDWLEYSDIAVIGGREYLAKEDPSTIPYAKRKAKIWWFVTTLLKWCFICGFVYYLM